MLPINNFVADRTFNDSIKLSWSEDVKGSFIKIIRKMRDYPYHILDGVMIYSGPASWGYFEDTNVVDSQWHYYQLFFWNPSSNNYETDSSLRASSLAVIKVGMDAILKQQTPSMYSVEEMDSDDPFCWSTIRKEVFGNLFEEVAGLIRSFSHSVDADECRVNSIAGLAKLVGLIPNLEMPYIRQREEVKAMVDIWKTKGTEYSIIRAVRALTGMDAVIDIWVDNIILTNFVDRKTFDFSDANEVLNYRKLGHKTCHTLDFNSFDYSHWYNTFSLGVYISYTDASAELRQETVRKLKRVIKDYIPAFDKLHMFFESVLTFFEVYPYYPVYEESFDSLRTRSFDQLEFSKYLISCRLARKSCSSRYRVARSTSQKLSKDVWFDEVRNK